MANAERILHQFKNSQFSEKARWALDHKGLAYRKHEVLVGPGQVLLKLRTGSRQVPVLDDGGRTVVGSTNILDHLDAQYPDAPLWPLDAAEKAVARDFVEWADEKIGKGSRGYLLASARHDPRLASMAGVANTLGPTLIKLGASQCGYDSLDAAERGFPASLLELKRRLGDKEYLVGDRFTAADLTACALVNPVYTPRGASMGSEWSRKRPALANDPEFTPVFDWFDRIYETHRRPASPPR